MPEIKIISLEPRLQKLVESARSALDRGQPEQAIEHCAKVLEVHPDCLQVRKMERAAQLKFAALRRNLVTKFLTTVSSAPFLIGGSLKLKNDPRSALATAERLLRSDPYNVSALHLLGEAASALGWSDTAVFAHEHASDLEPDRPDLLISLGNACLAAGRSADAARSANQALEIQPDNAEAKTLLQNALVAVSVKAGQWEKGG